MTSHKKVNTGHISDTFTDNIFYLFTKTFNNNMIIHSPQPKGFFLPKPTLPESRLKPRSLAHHTPSSHPNHLPASPEQHINIVFHSVK